MTPFQTRCVQRVRDWLSERGQTTAFEEVHGQKESYLRGMIAHHRGPMEIFVYENEAGFMRSDKEWVICEQFDFSSEEELIVQLLEKLTDEFDTPPLTG